MSLTGFANLDADIDNARSQTMPAAIHQPRAFGRFAVQRHDHAVFDGQGPDLIRPGFRVDQAGVIEMVGHSAPF